MCDRAKCVVASMFEFTVNEATACSYIRLVEGESKIKVVITMIFMLAITESITGKWF